MFYSKHLSSASHLERKVKEILNASKLPFWVKSVGFLSEKKLTVEADDFSDYIILFSLSGVAQFMYRKESKYIHKEELIISPCDATLKFNQVSREKWEFLYLVFNGSHAKYMYNMIRTKNNTFHINPPSQVIDPFIRLLDIDYDDSVASAVKASMIIHNILSAIYEASLNIMRSKALIPIQDTHVNTAINYIINNYKSDLSIDAICTHIGFTKYYFCRIFKEITGDTIHQFVNKYRVNCAKDLLSYSTLTVTAVGESVGFRNLGTFIRVFKSVTGMTPEEYRSNF